MDELDLVLKHVDQAFDGLLFLHEVVAETLQNEKKPFFVH